LKAFGAFVAAVLATSCVRASAQTAKMPVDPGLRSCTAGASAFLSNTTTQALSSDGTEPVKSAPAAESPTSETLAQLPTPPPSAQSVCSAASLSQSQLQDRSEKRRRHEWLALTITQHSAATFDAWSTRRVISSGQGQELNPMLRPFAGNASLYAVIQVVPVLFDYLGRRMMTSHRGWARRTWWVPQAVSTTASLASGAYNLSIQ
jgi:hypothetical protein